MQDYRKLAVWQKAHKLALSAYGVSAHLKTPEGWPLRDQLLRAAISIPSNMAEGRPRIQSRFLQVLVALNGFLQRT